MKRRIVWLAFALMSALASVACCLLSDYLWRRFAGAELIFHDLLPVVGLVILLSSELSRRSPGTFARAVGEGILLGSCFFGLGFFGMSLAVGEVFELMGYSIAHLNIFILFINFLILLPVGIFAGGLVGCLYGVGKRKSDLGLVPPEGVPNGR